MGPWAGEKNARADKSLEKWQPKTVRPPIILPKKYLSLVYIILANLLWSLHFLKSLPARCILCYLSWETKKFLKETLLTVGTIHVLEDVSFVSCGLPPKSHASGAFSGGVYDKIDSWIKPGFHSCILLVNVADDIFVYKNVQTRFVAPQNPSIDTCLVGWLSATTISLI